MDLTLPLRSLIPSLDSDVLAVLSRTESALGATRIARLADRGSRQGVSRVLDRLVEHGLVLAHPTNAGHVYQLNRRHVLVPALTSALEAGERVRGLLTEQVRGLRPRPAHASVFGSFARGEGSPGSDIDLLIVVPADQDPHEDTWVAQVRAAQEQVLVATGNRLEPLVLTLEGLANAVAAGEPIVDSLAADSVLLAGQPFGELIRAGASR